MAEKDVQIEGVGSARSAKRRPHGSSSGFDRFGLSFSPFIRYYGLGQGFAASLQLGVFGQVLGLDNRPLSRPATGILNRILMTSRQQTLDPDWLEPATETNVEVSGGRSESTLRAYRSDWADFTAWCRSENRDALPTSTATVTLYLRDRATVLKLSTLARRVSAINRAHEVAGYNSPTESSVVRKLMAEFRKTKDSTPVAKRPVLVDDLKAMSSELPNTILGFRDRALLLLGFTGGLRRSELVAIDCEDLHHNQRGLVMTLRARGMHGRGRKVEIPFGSVRDGTCPVAAFDEWLKKSAITTGAIFRVITRHGRILDKRLSGEAVGLVVKRWVKSVGYDPTQFGAHSLRAGLATSAAIAGKSERAIMRQTGHRSIASIRRYVLESGSQRENAAEGLGL